MLPRGKRLEFLTEWLNEESCGDGFVRVWQGGECDWLGLGSG